MEKESFKFRTAWYEAIRDLPKEIQGEILTAVMEYGLYGVETVLKPTARAVFMLIRQDIDKESARSENGRKGGRPTEKKPTKDEKIPRAKPVPRSLGGKAREIFENHFRETFQSEYYWTAKDATNMKGLLSKLQYALSSRGHPTTDEQVLATLKAFLDTIQDGWIYEHFSVSVINSKYNEIVTNIKAKRNGHNSTADSPKRTANQIVFTDLANDIAAHRQGMGDTTDKPY